MVGWVSKTKWSLLGSLIALVLIAIVVVFLPPVADGINWITGRNVTEDREPGVEDRELEIGDEPVEMEVVGVRANTEDMTGVVVLKEKEGERYLPIWIGFSEGFSIDLALRQEFPPRPFYHDLLINAIEELD